MGICFQSANQLASTFPLRRSELLKVAGSTSGLAALWGRLRSCCEGFDYFSEDLGPPGFGMSNASKAKKVTSAPTSLINASELSCCYEISSYSDCTPK